MDICSVDSDEVLNASSPQFLSIVKCFTASSLRFLFSVKRCFIGVNFYRKTSFNASSPLFFKVTLPTSAPNTPVLWAVQDAAPSPHHFNIQWEEGEEVVSISELKACTDDTTTTKQSQRCSWTPGLHHIQFLLPPLQPPQSQGRLPVDSHNRCCSDQCYCLFTFPPPLFSPHLFSPHTRNRLSLKWPHFIGKAWFCTPQCGGACWYTGLLAKTYVAIDGQV
jgi:hypothetical protein